MLGAIIGDMVGTFWEKHNRFPDSIRDCPGCFTDDTVLTVATAGTLLKAVREKRPVRSLDFEDAYLSWAWKYKDRGFGNRFLKWVVNPHTGSRDSFGNGAAMRVSPCAYLADSLEDALELARLSSVVSHNEPSAILAAQAIACSTFLARLGISKEQILDEVDLRFYPRADINFKSRLAPGSRADVTAPLAICAFMRGNSFSEAVDLAVANSQDKDTVGAMAGSIAEAFYGMSLELATGAKTVLPEEMVCVIEEFQDEVAAGATVAVR